MQPTAATPNPPTTKGHLPTLIAAFLHFDLSFMLWVLLGALCTISPLRTFVPVPAAKVPADAATSTPPFPAVTVLTEIVYVLVDPDATEVGPVMVTVGAVPLL